jgi:hypothetical protein
MFKELQVSLEDQQASSILDKRDLTGQLIIEEPTTVTVNGVAAPSDYSNGQQALVRGFVNSVNNATPGLEFNARLNAETNDALYGMSTICDSKFVRVLMWSFKQLILHKLSAWLNVTFR